MDTQKLLDLIGCSNLSPEIKEAFAELHIPPELPEMSICWRRYDLKDKGLILQFLAKSNWRYDYGMPDLQYTQDWEEEFLQEIEFGQYGGGQRYKGDLPFGLAFDDSPGEVKEKMKIKVSGKGTSSYGSYCEFHTADRLVFVAFDNEEKLIWMRVRPLELSFVKKRALDQSLRQQNKNITDAGIKQLQQMKASGPVAIWRKRMEEGDGMFTDAAVKATDTVLQTFIDQLIAAVEKKKAAAVLSAVRKTVVQLNKLNERHDSYIETLEREELVDFIHTAIKLTGFSLEEGLDVTAEWRDW